jgi:hypothetical protein
VELPGLLQDAPLRHALTGDGGRDARHGAGPADLLLLAAQRRILRRVLLRLARPPGAVHRVPPAGGRPGAAPPPRASPRSPYLRTLAPAVYALFGIDETYDLHGARAWRGPGAADRGRDELGRLAEARLGRRSRSSASCPNYTAPALDDNRPAGASRRETVHAGISALRRRCTPRPHARSRDRGTRAGPPPHALGRPTTSRRPRSGSPRAAHVDDPAYARESTRAEAVDANGVSRFYHMLYLGEVHRLAAMIGADRLAGDLRARLAALAAELEKETDLRVCRSARSSASRPARASSRWRPHDACFPFRWSRAKRRWYERLTFGGVPWPQPTSVRRAKRNRERSPRNPASRLGGPAPSS